MFLETQRLYLRKFEEVDFDDYCEYSLNVPGLDRMMGRDPLRTRDDVRSNFNWLKDKEERAYVLVLKESGKVIGNLTVYNKTPFCDSIVDLHGKLGRGLSFCISEHYRREGLMYEAVSAVIRKLFLDESADYIQCGCFDFNQPSLALQRKLGFTFLMSEQFTTNGEQRTSIENILWNTGAK